MIAALTYVLYALFFFSIVYQALYFVVIAFSPHTDTSSRVFLNALISAVLFVAANSLIHNNVVALLARVVIVVVNGFIVECLKKIKYYS